MAHALPADGLLAAFLRGDLSTLRQDVDGRLRTDAPAPPALLPGSFNPLHLGHLHLATTAGRLLGLPVAFELTVTNADKPPLPPEEVHRRLPQLQWRGELWLTRAPTYAEKAHLFPGTVFIVGADTAERIVAPRFYGDSDARRAEALARLRDLGCRFLVAGRQGPRGFVAAEDLALPDDCRDLFRPLSRAEFDVPISSSDLRARAASTC